MNPITLSDGFGFGYHVNKELNTKKMLNETSVLNGLALLPLISVVVGAVRIARGIETYRDADLVTNLEHRSHQKKFAIVQVLRGTAEIVGGFALAFFIADIAMTVFRMVKGNRAKPETVIHVRPEHPWIKKPDFTPTFTVDPSSLNQQTYYAIYPTDYTAAHQ